MIRTNKIQMRKNFWMKNSQVVIITVFTVVILIVSACMDKDFLSVRNVNNLVLNALPIMIAGLGQMMVILSGGIDLSLGSMVSLCNVVCVAMMNKDEPISSITAIVITLLVGTVAGALNGVLIAKVRLAPVIATIATMSVYGGLALFIQPIPGGSVVDSFAKILMGKSGFPMHILLMLWMVLLAWYLTTGSTFGKKMRAIGGNEEAAYSTGINVGITKIGVYALAGCFSAVAAIFLSAQMHCGDATIGASYSMNTITVVVVGGTLLTGAVGNVLGTVVGAFMLMILNNILNLVGTSSFYQYVFQGMILIIALAISSLRTKNSVIG